MHRNHRRQNSRSRKGYRRNFVFFYFVSLWILLANVAFADDHRSEQAIDKMKLFAATGIANGALGEFELDKGDSSRIVVMHCRSEFSSEWVVWATESDGFIIGGSFLAASNEKVPWSGTFFPTVEVERAQRFAEIFKKCERRVDNGVADAKDSRTGDPDTWVDIYIGKNGSLRHTKIWFSLKEAEMKRDVQTEANELIELLREKGQKPTQAQPKPSGKEKPPRPK